MTRLSQWSWLIALVGLPFSFLVDRRLESWYVNTHWMVGWTVWLWSLGWGQGHRATKPNRPLGAWVAWTGVWTVVTWHRTLAVNTAYPMAMLPGVLHFLTLVLLYHAAVTQWTPAFLSTLLRGMAWAGVVMLGYCALQALGLDEFFHHFDPRTTTHPIVGTLGNTAHLAAYFSFVFPLFWLQRTWTWKVMGGIAAIIILLQQSFGGIIALGVAITWIVWWTDRRRLPLVILAWLIVSGCALVLGSASLHGRWQAWQAFWPLFQQTPYTGHGLGYVWVYVRSLPQGPLFQWSHTHNELYQLALEQGLIGVACCLAWLRRIVKQIGSAHKTQDVLTLVAILLAFLTNSLVNYCAHLWTLGIFAIVAIAGLEVLTTWDSGSSSSLPSST